MGDNLQGPVFLGGIIIKVLFESQPLLGRRTGIGRYVERLTASLQENQDIDLFYWFNQQFNVKLLQMLDVPSTKIRNSRYFYKVIRRLMKPNFLHDLPVDLGESFDIFHGGSCITYQTTKAKNALTIHDLAFLQFPEVASEQTDRHHSLWLPYSIKKADHIIAVSQHTKEDIIRYYDVPDEKISVIYLAADDQIKKEDRPLKEEVQAKYNLPEKYALYVGTIEPRKNIPFMLEGYALAKQKYKFPHKLVIAGAKGWKYEKVYETFEKYRLHNDVIFTGYVEDMDLPVLYENADVFLFPSRYEGFGIPVLEAMQCGVAVIASNVSSLPEIVGEAGRLVSLEKPEEFIDSIGELLTNEAKRREYEEAGRRQARMFSWKKAASETVTVYRSLL
uniref:Putative mannosyltransferase n=1 Tax=Aneurinibacillus thermoaerophilus TaxID=143495 RepID=Q6T1V8_ANETH|nr:putative mannosyltransferase [Aneurinibacillus thermoaerophilus]